jgi:hypothetical protein
MSNFDLELKRKNFLNTDENNFYLSISFFCENNKINFKNYWKIYRLKKEREGVEDDLNKTKKKRRYNR